MHRSTLRYSHCERDSGRCHNTQLFCKNLVTNFDHARTVVHALVDDELGDGNDEAVCSAGDNTQASGRNLVTYNDDDAGVIVLMILLMLLATVLIMLLMLI